MLACVLLLNIKNQRDYYRIGWQYWGKLKHGRLNNDRYKKIKTFHVWRSTKSGYFCINLAKHAKKEKMRLYAILLLKGFEP